MLTAISNCLTRFDNSAYNKGIEVYSRNNKMITHYRGNLGFPVETGHIFVLSGRTLDGASQLDIHFASSKMDGSTIPLYMSVCFHEDVIIRNSFIDGIGWGTEEIEPNIEDVSMRNPITSGEKFHIYILVGDNKFHIALNGISFCTYDFRTVLSEIRTIVVNKDLQQITQVDHRQAFPFPRPIVQFDDPIFEFSNDVPNPFTEGHVVIITGIPYGNPKGMFLVRLTEGEKTEKQAVHFNPRFEQSVVVRTDAFIDGTFGPEERSGGFPFKLEQQFKLAIAFTDNAFKFAVNGKFFCRFDYRSANVLPLVNGVKISTRLGMQIEITGVDHINLGSSDCFGFHEYSDPDTQLY